MRLLVLVAAVSAVLLAGSPPSPSPSPDHETAPATWRAVIEAEDARAVTDAQLRLLTRAARTTSSLQPTAVRALGRLERPDLAQTLLPLLDDPAPAVRAEAADALAQSAATDVAAARAVREGLLRRLVAERDGDAREALAAALGRLPTDSPSVAVDVEKVLVGMTSRVEKAGRVDAQAVGGRILGLSLAPSRRTEVALVPLLGALRGLESTARVKGKSKQAFLPETIARLKALILIDPATTRPRRGLDGESAARARRLALLCLLPASGVDDDLAARAQADPDAQVRRLAVSSAAASRATVGRALTDPAWLVRYEALRAYGRRFQAAEGCGPILSRVDDRADHVALLAIDLLAGPCNAGDGAVETLLRILDTRAHGGWQAPAHALVALATAAPTLLGPQLARLTTSPGWPSRMYAARAAAQVADVSVLHRLADDPVANVREAAISGLRRTAKHEADDVYVRALGSQDFQVIMTAAAALAGTPDRGAAVPALLAALARLTALDSDTSRDPRVAVLERLGELGSADQSGAIRGCLQDVDPRVAESCCKVLTAWTRTPVVSAPRARTESPVLPAEADIRTLRASRVRVTMADGGVFEMRLMTEVAPVTCHRFATLVRRGYYNGLTFHRVIPNFLIQGGSPGANEFAGDRRYFRDEPGRASQVRGTVGMSTRGRDTGDAQIYVNLVDTPRLDHDYYVFANVVRGMDVVDRILEADVMAKVEILGRSTR
jgi:cyclophilin family peptidyl-prolyl cis-trans isomerase/HEAT repeat protein